MTDLPEELQERIAAYLDGQLPPSEAARLEVYLANTDPALADMIVGMLADKSQLRGMPRPQAPIDLSARVMESIERASLLHNVEEITAPRRPRWQSKGAIAAGLALVLGGFAYFVASSVFRPAPSPILTASHRATDAARQLAMGGAADSGKIAPAIADASKDTGALTMTPSTLAAATAAPAASVPPAAETGPSLALNEKTAKTAEGLSQPPLEANAASKPNAEIASAAAQVPINEELINNLIAGVPPALPPPLLEAPPADAQGGANAPGAAPTAGAPPAPRLAGGGGRGGRGGRGAGGFGGAGGGGFGGARGGGVGTGNAAPPAAATALPAVSPPAADDPMKALTALTRSGNGPVLLTLSARDDQDHTRLAQSLTSYAGENARARQVGQASNLAAQNQLRNQIQNTNPSAPPGNNVQFANQNGNYTANNGSNSITVNTNGAVILEETPSAANSNQSQAQNNGRPNDQTRYNFSLALQLATARGGPYRATLSVAQLADLTKIYRVALIARDDEVHIFSPPTDKPPLGADAKERADLLRRASPEGATGNIVPQNLVPPADARSDATTFVDCIITLEAPPPAASGPAAP